MKMGMNLDFFEAPLYMSERDLWQSSNRLICFWRRFCLKKLLKSFGDFILCRYATTLCIALECYLVEILE
jgi:hypothetical protein